VAKVRV